LKFWAAHGIRAFNLDNSHWFSVRFSGSYSRTREARTRQSFQRQFALLPQAVVALDSGALMFFA
jgi:hypothetical protein